MISIIKDQHGAFFIGVSSLSVPLIFVKEIDDLLAVDRGAKIKDLRDLSRGRFYFVHWHVLPLEGCVHVCVYVDTNLYEHV